ncbi:hypothetical protein [Nonomuraea sediminis]|uniref:hypothetical protein n=1 Tax=Nonomuraea sediminis TaxID=2835864 RepID=UPI001BDCE673|nr:hypothetical protein [Nonomuraea sediminis]
MTGEEEAREQDPAALERMWQHSLHLDTMLFQRANLFLVVESLLIVAFALVLGVANQPGSAITDMALAVVRVIAVFGMLLTAVWGYVGHRHLRYYELLRARQRDVFPEYKELREQWRPRGISSLPLVTYFLPLLAGALWILCLLITLR